MRTRRQPARPCPRDARPRRAPRRNAPGRGNAARAAGLGPRSARAEEPERIWAGALERSVGQDGPRSGDGFRRSPGSGRRGNRSRTDGFFGRRRRRPTPRPQPRTVEPPAPAPVTVAPPTPTRQPEPAPTLARPGSMPTGRELIEGWEQTSKGNCVTVAAIKAAQMTFGADLCNTEDPTLGIFSEATPLPGGGMRIVMRDGFELTVSDAELEAAALSSRFRTDKDRQDLLDNANQLYAVAAKRAQLEGNDGFGPGEMSYARSLQALEDGEHTARIMEQVGRLGLKDYAHKAPRGDLKNHAATLSSGEGHAYFVSEGLRDFYGRVGALGPAGYQSSARSRRRSRNKKAPHSTTGTVLNRTRVKD